MHLAIDGNLWTYTKNAINGAFLGIFYIFVKLYMLKAL